MKEEYDFSKAERGKFYVKGATFQLPVYLDGKSMKFVAARAKSRKTDISTIVNELIHNDIRQAGNSK